MFKSVAFSMFCSVFCNKRTITDINFMARIILYKNGNTRQKIKKICFLCFCEMCNSIAILKLQNNSLCFISQFFKISKFDLVNRDIKDILYYSIKSKILFTFELYWNQSFYFSMIRFLICCFTFNCWIFCSLVDDFLQIEDNLIFTF